jgi:hypothetical protein
MGGAGVVADYAWFMKRILLWMLCAVAAASAQDLTRLTPAERAQLEAQDTALKALLQHTRKLPMEATAVKGWTMGRVSWIAADRNGLIYLLQRGDKADPVIVMNRSGGIVRSWGKGLFTTPHAIRIDRRGNIWTVDAGNSMVHEFSPEGEALLEIEIGGLPAHRTPCCGATDIAFAPNGNLFVADGYRNARIIEFTPQGKKLRQWGSAGTGPGQFNIPHSIQIDEDGVIYVSDRENGRIERFDLAGKYLGEWSNYGKTFGLKIESEAIWLSSYPRGAIDGAGWLLKVNRKTGKLLGYVDTTSGHGIDVTPDGEILAAAPVPDQAPLDYRLNE